VGHCTFLCIPTEFQFPFCSHCNEFALVTQPVFPLEISHPSDDPAPDPDPDRNEVSDWRCRRARNEIGRGKMLKDKLAGPLGIVPRRNGFRRFL